MTTATASSTTTTTTGAASTSSPSSYSFQDFCERHARHSAMDFSKSVLSFLNSLPPEVANGRSSVTHRDFMKLYVENFEKFFESDFLRRRQQKVRMRF